MEKNQWLLGGILFLIFILSGLTYKYKKRLIFNRTGDFESTTMPQIYQELVAKSNPFTLYGRNAEMLVILNKQLDQYPDNTILQMKVAFQNIYAGNTQTGIDMLEHLEKNDSFMKDSLHNIKGKNDWSVADSVVNYIALGYLRLGEQNNCLNNHNDESCVFPISGMGIHQDKLPAEKAIERYLKLIEINPADYLSVWLLNIACQAYGFVPDYVPKNLIISKKRIPDEYNIKRFNDIATDLGIENTGDAGGIALDDFDNDGYTDIINGSANLKGQIKYFHNNGDGTFSDFTQEAGLLGAWEGLGMMQFDYNNDGWMDFFVTRGGWKYKAGFLPPSLYRNNGNGTFTDVTIEAGLLQFAPSQTAETADIDLDGDLDLFIGHEMQTVSRLYENLGNGTFDDITRKAGVYHKGYVKGCSFGDYNNDGYPDLYISDFGDKNLLFKNEGPNEQNNITFEEVAEEAGVDSPLFSFPCWFFDYNNDGWEDIYVSAYKPGYTINSCREFMGLPMDPVLFPCLYENNQDGTFTNKSAQAHIQYETFTMGCNFGDLDNDGYLDFYLSIGAPDYRAIFPNRMFHNNEGKYFQDCTVSGGFGQLQKGHAVGFCDFDYDGDQDIYTDIGGFYTGDVFPNSLFENPGHGNNWINIKFEGVKSNKFGVGCKVKMVFIDSNQIRTTYNTIGKGASFGSNPVRLQAGVGKAKEIYKIEVIWPSIKSSQTFYHVPVNQIYLCKEDQPNLLNTDIESFVINTMERRMAKGDTSAKHSVHHMKM